MQATTAVSTAPKPLMIILARHRGSWRRSELPSCTSVPGASRPDFTQRRVMPACESVKERKTPIAYSGMRRVTLAWKITISAQARRARATIPREKTRRLPRYSSWRGRWPSAACSADRRGKPLKAVLAAMIRMRVVPAMAAKYGSVRPPYAVRAICEITVSVSEGTAPVGWRGRSGTGRAWPGSPPSRAG